MSRSNSTLFFFGAAAIALRALLQPLLARGGASSNATDFALGVLLGIGTSFLMMVAWRIGRGRRDPSSECD